MEDQLLPGTLEFAIHMLVETRLDTSGFAQKYRNDETGRTAYDPKILLKIVLLGYARGLISSRKIEQACRENVVFIALACGQQPDHSTIATFVSSMKDEILHLFRDVLGSLGPRVANTFLSSICANPKSGDLALYVLGCESGNIIL